MRGRIFFAACFLSLCGVALCTLLSSCTHDRETPEENPRVLILGIDGLEWDILDRYFEQGRLPALKKLVKEGASGRLKTVSAASPEIWTSVATGRLPAVHGIHGYTDTSDIRKVKAFWNILSEYGKRVILMNWWCTYPAEEIDGVNISSNALRGNFGRKLPAVIYPDSRCPELSAIMLDKEENPPPAYLMRSTLEKYLWEVDFERAARHLIAEPWSLFALYFHQIDFASHKWTAEVFRKDRDGFVKVASDEKAGELWKTIEFYYENMDRMVSEFMGCAGAGPLVVVLSDHGWAYDGRQHNHRPDGVVIFHGPNVKEGYRIEGASVLDVLPTVMWFMGLPISKEMDGKHLLDVFSEQSEARYVESYGPMEKTASPGLEVSEEYKEQLRSVGYIQ